MKKQEIHTADRFTKKDFFQIAGTTVVIVAAFLLSLFIFFMPDRVSGDSMNPTLEDNDILLLEKQDKYYRFDIIVFHRDGYDYIKRIIGLPGEHLQIRDGHIYINGALLQDYYAEEPIEMQAGLIDNVILGEDEYFVLGDNRNNSEDSRFPAVGNVSLQDIRGKAIFRVFPFSSFGPLLDS